MIDPQDTRGILCQGEIYWHPGRQEYAIVYHRNPHNQWCVLRSARLRIIKTRPGARRPLTVATWRSVPRGWELVSEAPEP